MKKTLLSPTTDYTGKHIVVLEGLAPVRKRPAMYIGSTNTRGLHHLINEIIDNSVDEALAGFAQNIWVKIHQDNSVSATDDGRGIPVDIMPAYKKSALEIVMTRLHAGGKFDSRAYKVSGGLHGVGASVVNALSLWMKVAVKRDGQIYFQLYKRGRPQEKLKTYKNRESKENVVKNLIPLSSGTSSMFLPDKIIFKEGIGLNFEILKKQIRQRAYLIPKLFFHLYDERSDDECHFYFEGGIVSLVKRLNKNKTVLTDPIFIQKKVNHFDIQVAIQYSDSFTETVESFVNVINTSEGGTHLTGFKTALTRAINNYTKKEGILKNSKLEIIGEDTREGLTAAVTVKMPSANLQLEGQTKTKLGNSEVAPIMTSVVNEALETYFEEHPQDTRKILEKIVLASKARLAAKAAKDAIIRKGALEGGTLPGKLADCQEKDPAMSEIFIVEGDSAGGSAKQGRDRRFQAILPLRGKILNTERARLDRIIEFTELKDLIIALGMGIGESFDSARLRYHRIIIMTDADVDGEHIATLLLTFFYRHLKPIIEQGHLYIAQPPLYKIQISKEVFYAYSEEEKEKILAEKKGKANIQRYKGLGEMNPDQLWETTMNPKKRILKKMTIEDAEKADQLFTTLMGKEVPPRKRFIQIHAKLATLDI